MKKMLLLCALMLCFVHAAVAESAYDAYCREQGITNDHLTAVIEIPGANLVLPVMQHPDDNGFYAAHDAHGKESAVGTLYTQAAYNASDFSDPVTVVYGGSGQEESPLRNLQQIYSGSFDACRTIYLHLPEGTEEYTVFAAVPYSSIHILHYYNFRSEQRFVSFFENVYQTRKLGMHLDSVLKPEPGETVLILSTSHRGDSEQRYLVMAKVIKVPK
ncbi:MAG: class B sortase [Clostridia bacterium]|nr:class B sortase [Clostridia bacterium]